jgi:ankyrin repeat protein
VVRPLFEKGADINAQGEEYGNALQASAKGRERVALLLPEKGADVNDQGGEYGNALQAAPTEGHKQIVRLLLEMGAGINAKGGERQWGSPQFSCAGQAIVDPTQSSSMP